MAKTQTGSKRSKTAPPLTTWNPPTQRSLGSTFFKCFCYCWCPFLVLTYFMMVFVLIQTWAHGQVSFIINEDPSTRYSVDHRKQILHRSDSSAEHMFKLEDGYVYTKHKGDDICYGRDITDQERSNIENFIRLSLPPYYAEELHESSSGNHKCTVLEADIPYAGPEADSVHVEYCVADKFNYETRITDPNMHGVLFDVRYFSDHQRLKSSDRQFNEHLFCP
ncbi:hypothetical protein GEMRC1_003622 [Eukaryota sp. GEM-RC1]